MPETRARVKEAAEIPVFLDPVFFLYPVIPWLDHGIHAVSPYRTPGFRFRP